MDLQRLEPIKQQVVVQLPQHTALAVELVEPRYTEAVVRPREQVLDPVPAKPGESAVEQI